MSFIDYLRKRATGILSDDYSGMSSDAMPPEKGFDMANPSYERKDSPLIIAKDAIVIDNSDLSIEEQLDSVLKIIKSRFSL